MEKAAERYEKKRDGEEENSIGFKMHRGAAEGQI